METLNVTWNDVYQLTIEMKERMINRHMVGELKNNTIYPVPRGGFYPALLLSGMTGATIVDKVQYSDFIVDDIIDSGTTQSKYSKDMPAGGFYTLIDKKESRYKGKWIIFPWEAMTSDKKPEDAVIRLLEWIGENPSRDGLKATPTRVLESYYELYRGYDKTTKPDLRTFDEKSDEMVILKDCEFCSMCEHHMLPFFGKAHIAYLPHSGKVVGVSKLARLLDYFSRRLQIQERICQEVTTCLDEELETNGSACILEAIHTCMSCRGVNKQHSKMITSSLTGVFREDPLARQELIALTR